MKKILFIVFAAIAPFLSGITAPAQIFEGRVEGVAARVNEDVITTSEVDDMLIEIEKQEAITTQQQYEELRRMVLSRLIDQTLLVQEGRKRGYEMDKVEKQQRVERRWQRQVESYGGPQSMQAHLKASGITEEEVKARLEKEIERTYLQERVLRAEVNQHVQITPEDIEEYRRENRRQIQALDQADVSLILIEIPSDASPAKEQEAMEKADRLVTEIRAKGPESFAEIARENSDHMSAEKGGALGVIRRGELGEDFDVAFELEPGEISNPIRTPKGIMILQVNARLTPYDIVLQSKQKEVIDALMEDLREEAIIMVKGGEPLAE